MAEARTMKEIADLAGVSVATVSRVINHNGRFSKATESRVNQIIRENHYMTDMSAKGLRTRTLSSVGVVVPDITNPYFAELVLGIQTNLFEEGYTCIICNTNESQELEDSHLASLKAQNVAGMIMISLRRFHKSLRKYPTVYVDRPAVGGDGDFQDCMIESDNVRGGYLAAQQLLTAGCRKMAILKSHNKDINQTNRFEGAWKAFAERGLREEEISLIDIDTVTISEAYSRVLEALDQGITFDGLLTTADMLAVGACSALMDRQYRIPEDVKVTGFDDCSLAIACGPGLTSVRQDTKEMARLSVELLMKQIRREPIITHHFTLPVSLTIRNSTSAGRH